MKITSAGMPTMACFVHVAAASRPWRLRSRCLNTTRRSSSSIADAVRMENNPPLRGNGSATARAFSLQEQVTYYWNILQGRNGMAAMRTGRARNEQVVVSRGFKSLPIKFGALSMPFALQHFGQAMDNDVQKTSDEQP